MNTKSTPRFKQVYTELKDALQGKLYQGKTMLPSENALCQEYGTSRQTIRSALKLLDDDGLVCNMPGKGWHIIREGSLRPISTKHIGHVIFLGRNDQACSLQYKGINEHAGALGISTEFIPLSFFGDEQGNVDLTRLNTKDCDGIIYFSDAKAPVSLIQFIERSQKPFVQLGHLGYYNFDTICGDYYTGLIRLVEKLHQLGYRNIAFTGQRVLHNILDVFKERVRGYRHACEILQLPEKCRLTDWGELMQAHADEEFLEWLLEGKQPVCIIASAGHELAQICGFLARRGIHSPKHVGLALIGDPNIEETRTFYPIGQVTMLIEPWEQLGHICIQRIAQRIQGDQSAPHLSMIPLDVILGDSTESDFDI